MPRRQEGDAALWVVRVGSGGWVIVSQHRRGDAIHPIPAEQFLIRVQPDENGRYRIHELLVFPAGEPMTADRLRAVRVSAIEQLLNLPEERAEIEARLAQRAEFEQSLNNFLFGQRRSRRLHATQGAPLNPPSGRGYPDDFYERVADTYRNALRRGDRPVVAIAVEAGVPRSTAARWVKETRRRGLLGSAPAPGKAGE